MDYGKACKVFDTISKKNCRKCEKDCRRCVISECLDILALEIENELFRNPSVRNAIIKGEIESYYNG